MLRACLFTFLLTLAPPLVAADVPAIPAAKRKEFVDAILAKKPKGEEVILLKMKALEKAVVDSSLPRNEYPAVPTDPPSFRDKKSRDAYEKELKAKLGEARAEMKRYADNPLAFAPGLNGYSKGNIGVLKLDRVKVADVVDGKRALLAIAGEVIPAQVPNVPVPKPVSLNVMLAGIDTSDLADGKAYPLNGIYYVTGNAKSSAGTVMQIVPMKLTEQELKTLREAELKTEKK